MQSIWAEHVLSADGWLKNARVDIDDQGYISAIEENVAKTGIGVDALIPAPSNLHSHSFQRAMAGMTEQRGQDPDDNFWSWRKLMYKFLEHLTPEDIQAIAAFTQMEMLEAGFGASAEFHYLHHQADGSPYNNIAELSERICVAADETGIGLTLLPVLYQYGGCDQRALGKGQIRFGNDEDRFSRLYEAASTAITSLPSDTRIGVAPHSLRAVSQEGLTTIIELCKKGPIHVHAAEQDAEVAEVLAAWGHRPVEWLFEHHKIDTRWCLIHATQMQAHETVAVAQSGAVAGLCPITESNLGDGIFDGIRYLENKGVFGIGSDSNIRISLSEELRTLEYSQRLQSKKRAVLATLKKSTGRVLIEGAAFGGARACGRQAGMIEVGKLADLLALNTNHVDLADKAGDAILDSYIFAGDDRMISNVWSAGRHLVKDGQHIKHQAIEARYRATLKSIKSKI